MITGVALRKHNRVIQFSVIERDILPDAEVDPVVRYGPNAWKISDFDYLKSSESKEGVDYHTLTWDNRSMNLDTIVLPSNQVLTGVRFILIDGRLALQIRGTDIDFNTWKLMNLEQSVWINNAANLEERKKIEVLGRDVPTRSINLHNPVNSVNKFIEFEPSDVRRDLAQVSVPYIESVLLEASDPQALAGLGLFYKTDQQYSGFIAIKLIAYDLQPTIEPPNPHAVYHLKTGAVESALPTNLNLST